MDLSLNKINQIKTANINFKGMKAEPDSGNVPKYEFTIPPHNHNEIVTLELAFLEPDKTTGFYKEPKEDDFYEADFFEKEQGKDTYTEIPILQVIQESLEDQKAFAYRYRITNTETNETRYATDQSVTINVADNKGKMNYIELGGNYSFSPKGGSMYHAFVDSNKIKDISKAPKVGSRLETRNHFNKFGGSLKDILDLLKNTDTFASYRYLMLNPDIGNDRISSHKYWPENQYQCTNMDDFKELNRELFEQGKGYVADGAFTSQGLNSPIVQHVFKWGEDSPCAQMLKMDGRICAGVLPDMSANDKEDVLANIGIRLVNNPYDSENYDKSKPTYIQFFDKRLLSEQKQNDSKNLIFNYDKAPDDHYELVKHQDSVLPIAFEIDPSDKKIKEIVKDGDTKIMLNQIENLDDFLTFKNGTITDKRHTSGTTTWDGNVDIIKMNTDNPDVRKYLLGVATFWTETVQRDLILDTALKSEADKKILAKNNDISPSRYNEIKATINTEDFESPILIQNKKVADYIKEFPLQSIETAPELSAVFVQPQFQNEFLSKKIDNQTVGEKLEDIVNNTLDNAIPIEYKDNSQYRTYAIKTFAPEIIRNVLIGAMGDDLIDADGKADLDKLKNINIKTLEKHNSYSADDERRQVISAIASGINENSAESIRTKIIKDLCGISLDDFKMAESIVLQGKGGLNWRFDAAKDIGDLDAIRNGDVTFQQIWEGDEYNPGVVNFWANFVKNIRDYNPSSFVINEITCLDEFYKWHEQQSILEYGGEEALARFNALSDDEKNNYKLNIAYQTEKKYLRDTNSTTTSMFDQGFNRFSAFVGVNPESGVACGQNTCGNMQTIVNEMRDLEKYTQPNNSIFAHSFFQNHDKPALLHALPLDMGLFLQGDMSSSSNKNPFYNYIATDVTGRTDYENISSKAVAVGYMLKKGIDEQFPDGEQKDKLNAAICNLANGKRDAAGKNDFSRADAFGATPFELSLVDIANDAGVNFDTDLMHFKNMEDVADQQMAMAKISNACPGVFTWFNGSEFLQTGFETKNKNVYVTNRNLVRRDLKDNPLYAPYVEEIQANMGLYKKPEMSALGGGYHRFLNVQNKDNSEETAKSGSENFEKFKSLIIDFIGSTRNYNNVTGQNVEIDSKLMFEVLDKTMNTEDFNNLVEKAFKIKSEDIPDFLSEYKELKEFFTESQESKISIAPAYFYDEKGSRVVMVATNYGLPVEKHLRDEQQYIEGKQEYISPVDVRVSTKKEPYYVDKISLIDDETKESPLEDGTILKRKIYDKSKGDFVDEPIEYEVKNGAIVKKTAVSKTKLDDNDKIKIDDSTAIFYAPKKNKYPYMASLYSGIK